MTEAARAFWSGGDGRGELRALQLPSPAPTQVVVEMLASGISRGTESMVFSGLVPKSEWQRMRCPHQEGEFPGPVKYGYCAVGRVVVGPPELLGQRVFCLHPHQTRFVVEAKAVYPIPQHIPTKRAVLAANMETALNAMWDLAPRVGDRISVVGAGVVGSLVAALAVRLPGSHVQLVDPDAHRAAFAQLLGCSYAQPEHAQGEADAVVHSSGHPQGLQTALALAGFEATVLELSWYGNQSVALALGEAFHAKRLTLRASQVGAVAGAQRARWDYQRRMHMAISLLADDRLDALIPYESSFDNLPDTMAQLTKSPLGALCHVVRYD